MADSGEHVRVLIAEDEEWSLTVLHALIAENDFSGWHITIDDAKNGNEAVALLGQQVYDLVITDLRMEGLDGLGVLRAAKEQIYDPEVLLMTAYAEVETAVKAIKGGAFDYLTKPLEPERTTVAIKRALERKSLKRQVSALQKQLGERRARQRIVAESAAMKKVISVVNMIAATDANVLIEGENGTGKEVIARAIHDASNRRAGPFVAVNCGALPENLLESELFGYTKGAFTGADRDRKGYFEQAEGGTLLLDEIGDVPLHLQVKLLRVLQESEIQKIGSQNSIKVDTRVLSATNRNLSEMVDEKLFRQDLYYRLRVVPVQIPPLRDRKEDIIHLATTFLYRYSGGEEDNRKALSPDVIAALLNYPWPGNVRELENVIRGSIALSPSSIIGYPVIASLLQIEQPPQIADKEDPLHLSKIQDITERQHIISMLSECGGNQVQAAKELGISRTSLWRKMKKHNILSDEYGPTPADDGMFTD